MLETCELPDASDRPATALRRDRAMPRLPIVEELDYHEPLAAVRKMPCEPGLVFLDSAMPHADLGRWSWLAPDPFGRFLSVNGEATWNGVPAEGHPIEALRGLLRRFAGPAHPGPPFRGGASGFFSYEAGRLFERLPPPKWRRSPCPEIDLWFHDVGVLFDVVERRAFLVSTGWPEADPLRREARALDRLKWLRDRLENQAARPPGAPVHLARESWRPNMSADAFQAVVERTRRYIADGDIFQANLSRALRAELPSGPDPVALYGQLRSANPAPFGALIVGAQRTIASTSPEGFLLYRDGEVETRPIKGTMRRSSDPQEDRALGEKLLASEKDRAENIMIVDLMRNDLSRVCLPGSVLTPVLCGLESYASVHHLVSVVRGHLKPGLDALHLLAACFPGGSITGAPKIRAMEIIHALEPEPRGVYCGSILHLGFDGSLRSSIAIRTLVAEAGVASIHAGGGITLLSDPEEEYAETAIKAERMLAAFDADAGA